MRVASRLPFRPFDPEVIDATIADSAPTIRAGFTAPLKRVLE
jgi:hypothetical protein